MFLATTALTDFWDTSTSPILFLGDWCLRKDRRPDWEALDRRVLPSPWDDRLALHRAAETMDEFGERLLPQIADYLNSLHGVNHDLRYWRILLGPWLIHALHIYYDRWVTVGEALRRHPDLTTIVLDPADYARGFSSLQWDLLSTTSDAFNLQIFSEVFTDLGCKFPSRRLSQVPELTTSPSLRARLRGAAMSTITAVGVAASRVVPGTILFHQAAAYLGLSGLLKLMTASRFRLWPFEPDQDRGNASSRSEPRRRETRAFHARDRFESFFVRRLSEILPASVVEDYERKRDLARRVGPSTVLATFGGWYASEPFCFTAAEAYARGARLAGVQHGGGYGMLRAAPMEAHERRVADRFLAWGWASERDANVVNVPAATVSAFRRVRRSKEAADVVFIATEHPRYVYRFHSTPVGSQWERYYDWQARFLEALPSAVRTRVRFRANRYASFYRQGQVERLAGRFPWLQWDSVPRLTDSLRHARLVIADHHGTSFLQVLASGTPIVLYWDPELWELNPAAQKLFDRLRQGGVLFDDPESAAGNVARIYQDADGWWSMPEVEAARREFTARFLIHDNDWARIWARTLVDIDSRNVGVPDGSENIRQPVGL